MNNYLLLAIGAILGSSLRYSITLYSTAKKWTPYSTIGINVTGSFILGIITQLGVLNVLNPSMIVLLGTGFCGSYTTFSTFAVDVVKSMDKNNYEQAMMVVVLSNILGIAAAFSGYKITSQIVKNRLR